MAEEGLNRVMLIGRLGQAPELRFTQTNKGVLSLRMATTESWFDKDTKQRKEETEWHSVVVWGPRAEALNKILSKGSRIAVEGKNKTRSWEDKNGGGKRYATEVVANNIILLGGKGENQGGAAGSGGPSDATGGDDQSGYSQSGGDHPVGADDSTDDIPF